MKTKQEMIVYDLNTKYIKKNILIMFITLIIVGSVIFALSCLSFPNILKYIGIVMWVAPCSFLLGGMGCIIAIVGNLKLLKYNKKQLLIIQSDKILYNAYLHKNIVINKNNIQKINLTQINKDMRWMIYLRIKLKETIENESLNIKSNIFNFNRQTSNPNEIYINISELKGNPTEIVSNIANMLGIEIKPNKRILPDF